MLIHRRLDLKIGFLCNNACLHCVQGEKRATFGNKSLKQLKRELKTGRKACDQVVFTGGEPTLHECFLEAVEYARELGFKVIQVQSNGRRFFYHDFCLQTIQAGANDFGLALLGHNPKLHDYIVRAKGSFSQTTRGIKNLKSLGVRVSTNTVISNMNYRYLPQIAQVLVGLDVDQYQFAFPHPLGRARDNFAQVVPRMKQVMPYVLRGLDVGIASGKRVMTEAIPYCLMPGYEKYIGENFIPSTDIYDADYTVYGYEKYRQEQGKSKGPRCRLCKYNLVCEGPWREYPQAFGWEEFVPVRNTDAKKHAKRKD